MIWLKVGLPIVAYIALVVINYGLFTAAYYKFLHTLEFTGWSKADKLQFIVLSLTGPIGLIIALPESLKRRHKPYFMWKRKPIIHARQERRIRQVFVPLDAEGRGYWVNADMSPEEEIASKMEWVQE